MKAFPLQNPRAFTTLELLLSIVLMGILLGFFLLYNQGTTTRTDHQTQVALFVAELRLAQSNAASGKEPGNFGIHLESDAYTIFEGITYNLSASSNRTVELPETIVIQNINLADNATDIVFTAPRGETMQAGTLEFHSEPLNESTIITLSPLGYVNY